MQAFLELPFVLLAYLTVCRWFAAPVYRAALRLAWPAGAAYTATFCLIEWPLRDAANATCHDVVTPPPAEVTSPETSQGGPRRTPAGVIGGTAGVRPSASSEPEPEESGGTSRITLRLPERLKPRIDEAASRMGLSVNAWLVRAVTVALELGAQSGDQDGGAPGGKRLGNRYTGWVR